MKPKPPILKITNNKFLVAGALKKYLELQYKGTFLKLRGSEEKEFIAGKDWATPSQLNFYLNDKFVNAYKDKLLDDDIICLFGAFEEIFKVYAESRMRFAEGHTEAELPLAFLSVFYLAPDKRTIQFIFSVNGNQDNYLNAFYQLLALIEDYNKPGSVFKSKIQKTYVQRRAKRYFVIYDNSKNNWVIINPLIQIGIGISKGMKHAIESRAQKPMPLIQEDDYRNRIGAFATNWRIASDGFMFVMDIPNDVALYSSMADKQLNLAQSFLIPRMQDLRRFRRDYGIMRREEQSQFFDYFENIIGAIIFSYSAIEAFANICIPRHYEITVKWKGKNVKHTKNEIERYWRLSDKLKTVLLEVLSTPNPAKTDWWPDFLALEEIRNEIIHTKESKSEDRYTKLLSQKTFELVAVNRRIIKYYGDFMVENKPYDLRKFPYGFGHDEVIPSITSAKEFERSYKVLHNIK